MSRTLISALAMALFLCAARPPEQDADEVTLAVSHHGTDKTQRLAIIRNLTRVLSKEGIELIPPKRLSREERHLSRDRSRKQRISTAARRLGANFLLDVETRDAAVRAAIYEVDTGHVRSAWNVENPGEQLEARELGERIAQSTLRSLQRVRSALVESARETDDATNANSPAFSIGDDFATADSADAFSADAFSADALSADAFSADSFSAGFGTVLEPAQVVEPSASASGPLFALGAFEVDAGARASIESFTYFESSSARVGPYRQKRRDAGDLAAHVEAKSETATIYSRLLLRGDLGEKARNRLEADQVWARFDLWPLELSIGRMYTTWGRANLASPTDIVNPRDYRDFIASEKLPSWTARAALTTGALRFELYYLPFFRPDIVPSPVLVDANGSLLSDSRWVNGTLPTVRDDGRNASYTFVPAAQEQWSLAHGEVAARVNATLGDIDASFGWLYGRDPFPSNVIEPGSLDDNTFPQTIRAEYVPRHAFTADAEWAVGNLHLVGEALLAVPQVRGGVDYDIGTRKYVRAVAGGDYTINDVRPGHALQLFLEVTGSALLDGEFPKNAFEPEYAMARARFPFPLAVMGRAAWVYQNHGQLSLTAMTNVGQFFEDGRKTVDRRDNEPGLDLYLRPELSVQLFQHFDGKVGFDLLLGERDEFFGSFHYNSRFTLALAASL